MKTRTTYYLDGTLVGRAPQGFGPGIKTMGPDNQTLRIDYCRQNASPRKRERLARAGVSLS